MSILITQCLQNDFVEPLNKFDPLPNALHIGYKESLRLIGEIPSEGPVNRLMEWAYACKEEDLSLIHIRDWHDANDPKQKAHLEQFGLHCLHHTKGAEFVFAEYRKPRGNETVINASGLNDFIDTELETVLNAYLGKKLRVGLTGVWTEAKILFLAYDLKSRYPDFELAVCSALCASSSTSMHFVALDQLKNILGVKIFDSVADFTAFLNGSIPAIEKQINKRLDFSHFKFDKESVTEQDKRLLCYLYRDAKEVDFNVLGGGFSGNAVLKAKAIDQFGHQQVPTVAKIGDRKLISRERTAFERIEEILGNTAPRIIDFAEEGERGAIKYRYAAMLDEKVTSFQKIYMKGAPDKEIFSLLDTVFLKQLGRLYKAGYPEKLNLLKYYDFSSKYAGSVRRKVEDLVGSDVGDAKINLLGKQIFNVCHFYEKELDTLVEDLANSHYVAYVHGDLNGQNMVVDAQRNVWIIDFFHTHQGHILKDLIKLENDLIFIFTSVQSLEEWQVATEFIDHIYNIGDLAIPPADKKFAFPQFDRALRMVQKLRSYYANLIHLDKDPYQFFIAMLRYNMHTLSFDECNEWQRKLSLYAGAIACERVRNYLFRSKQLRIDFLISELDTFTGNGKIGMTILPGRKDRGRELQADILVMKESGITSVINLVTDHELEEYGVPELMEAYKEAGFDAYRLRIQDQGVSLKEEMQSGVKWLHEKAEKQEKILIHCVGGLGRTGTLLACYLKYAAGFSAEQAIALVRKCRSPRAIENHMQEEFVKSY
jgi:protein-tyrosine phosphatase/nicotinamidase-related amidase